MLHVESGGCDAVVLPFQCFSVGQEGGERGSRGVAATGERLPLPVVVPQSARRLEWD